MGVRDIELRCSAEEQARANVNAILRLIHILEEKGMDMSDTEIARLLKISKEQVTVVRKAFSKRNMTTVDNTFMKEIITDLKNE
jgi:DNA-directed RNA polymerase specialized sigma subunit